MALERPSLQQLIDRVSAELSASLGGFASGFKRSFEYILARAVAGLSHGLHGHLFFISRQIFADTAEGEFLERQAGIYGINRVQASKATGFAEFRSSLPGVIIPAETVIVSPDNILYKTLVSSATITTPDADPNFPYPIFILVESIEPGSDGNTIVSETFTMQSPILNVSNDVSSGPFSGGADAETDDSLRERFLARLQKPLNGGTINDYIQWAREVPGVTRAFAVNAQFGIGTVGITFLRDNDGVGQSIIPDSSEVQAVQDYIDSKKPATADAIVFAPTAVEVNVTVTIQQAENPANNSILEANVANAIFNYFKTDPEPGGAVRVSRLSEAISLAEFERSHVITEPALDIEIGADEMAIPGTISVTLET